MRFNFFIVSFFCLVFSVLLAGMPPIASTLDAVQNSSDIQSDWKKFDQEVGARLTRVQEFAFIRSEAEKLGVRAYLFGGTAAGYAHYVNWDLKRQQGDPTYQPDRFDYDYTNIYHSTQDLDIVIDGPAEQAQQLQQELAKRFPYLQGNKTAWEVRLLRQDLGDKQALLHNPDFLDQHTDSNSTGMIEITRPPHGEPVVRDLRDWDAASQHREPQFLIDVREGALHYYYSPKHESTLYHKQGRNPPILSVIRYLTKAFQYDLRLRDEDLGKIKEIIDHFDPQGSEMKNTYVRNWLLNKENGRKLIKNAVNIEYAWNTLEKLGLRKKLIAIENDPEREGSLAWWMNKEPLRTRPIGSGSGITAREIFQKNGWAKANESIVLAHDSNSFLTYESITRAHTGDPNVLISRRGFFGESANNGDGFYTRVGRMGARGTGFTIRFTLDPSAREGSDFLVRGDHVVVLNKAAIRVIPESLSFADYFRMLAEGKDLDPSDRGILEKFSRRLNQMYFRGLSSEDETKVIEIMRAEISKLQLRHSSVDWEPLLNAWFSSPISARHIEISKDLLNLPQTSDIVAAKIIAHTPHDQYPLIRANDRVNKIIEKEIAAPKPDPGVLESLMDSLEYLRISRNNLVPWLRRHLEQLPSWGASSLYETSILSLSNVFHNPALDLEHSDLYQEFKNTLVKEAGNPLHLHGISGALKKMAPNDRNRTIDAIMEAAAKPNNSDHYPWAIFDEWIASGQYKPPRLYDWMHNGLSSMGYKVKLSLLQSIRLLPSHQQASFLEMCLNVPNDKFQLHALLNADWGHANTSAEMREVLASYMVDGRSHRKNKATEIFSRELDSEARDQVQLSCLKKIAAPSFGSWAPRVNLKSFFSDSFCARFNQDCMDSLISNLKWRPDGPERKELLTMVTDSQWVKPPLVWQELSYHADSDDMRKIALEHARAAYLQGEPWAQNVLLDGIQDSRNEYNFRKFLADAFDSTSRPKVKGRCALELTSNLKRLLGGSH